MPSTGDLKFSSSQRLDHPQAGKLWVRLDGRPIDEIEALDAPTEARLRAVLPDSATHLPEGAFPRMLAPGNPTMVNVAATGDTIEKRHLPTNAATVQTYQDVQTHPGAPTVFIGRHGHDGGMTGEDAPHTHRMFHNSNYDNNGYTGTLGTAKDNAVTAKLWETGLDPMIQTNYSMQSTSEPPTIGASSFGVAGYGDDTQIDHTHDTAVENGVMRIDSTLSDHRHTAEVRANNLDGDVQPLPATPEQIQGLKTYMFLLA